MSVSYGLEPRTVNGARVWMLLRLTKDGISEIGSWKSLRTAQRHMRKALTPTDTA